MSKMIQCSCVTQEAKLLLNSILVAEVKRYEGLNKALSDDPKAGAVFKRLSNLVADLLAEVRAMPECEGRGIR